MTRSLRIVPKTTFKSGFTLIEILIVIAVILLLVACLFPLAKTALEKANSAKCVSNLRGLAGAQRVYVAEHDDNFMPWAVGGNYWRSWFYEYLKDDKLLKCPSHHFEDLDKIKLSYAYNGALGAHKGSTAPAGMIMFLDASTYLATSTIYAGKYQYRQAIGRFHGDGANLAFVDGHVEWWDYDKIYKDADQPMAKQHFSSPTVW